MKNNTRAFVSQLLVCLLVTIGVGGTIGLGTVWLRHQISMTANGNRALAAEIVRLGRLIDERKTVIETEQAPDRLRGLNAVMHLGLVPMNEVNVVHVGENTLEHMAQRAREADAAAAGGDAPARVFLRIARH